jgi:hypothetical protein
MNTLIKMSALPYVIVAVSAVVVFEVIRRRWGFGSGQNRAAARPDFTQSVLAPLNKPLARSSIFVDIPRLARKVTVYLDNSTVGPVEGMSPFLLCFGPLCTSPRTFYAR